MTATLNGKPQRKQLADQLDRLDGIIDALADALPDAVRDAVRDGTEVALKQVLLELLSDPVTLSRIRQATGTNSPPPSSNPFERLRDKVTELSRRVLNRVQDAANQVRAADQVVRTRATGVVRNSIAKVQSVMTAFDLAWQLKRIIVIGVGIGLAVATVATLSHSAAAILAGTGAGTTAVAVQLGLWARRSLRKLAG